MYDDVYYFEHVVFLVDQKGLMWSVLAKSLFRFRSMECSSKYPSLFFTSQSTYLKNLIENSGTMIVEWRATHYMCRRQRAEFLDTIPTKSRSNNLSGVLFVATLTVTYLFNILKIRLTMSQDDPVHDSVFYVNQVVFLVRS